MVWSGRAAARQGRRAWLEQRGGSQIAAPTRDGMAWAIEADLGARVRRCGRVAVAGRAFGRAAVDLRDGRAVDRARLEIGERVIVGSDDVALVRPVSSRASDRSQ